MIKQPIRGDLFVRLFEEVDMETIEYLQNVLFEQNEMLRQKDETIERLEILIGQQEETIRKLQNKIDQFQQVVDYGLKIDYMRSHIKWKRLGISAEPLKNNEMILVPKFEKPERYFLFFFNLKLLESYFVIIRTVLFYF